MITKAPFLFGGTYIYYAYLNGKASYIFSMVKITFKKLMHLYTKLLVIWKVFWDQTVYSKFLRSSFLKPIQILCKQKFLLSYKWMPSLTIYSIVRIFNWVNKYDFDPGLPRRGS